MPALTRAESARINGAKSRGPVTLEGKARSSRNATKHAMTCAPKVTLVNESDPDFMLVYNAYKAKYQPRDQEELDHLDAMVSYRWRWFRSWGLESEYASENLREIYKELAGRAPGDPLILPAGRTFAAFHRAFETSKFFANLPVYEGRLRRGYKQCRTDLRQLLTERSGKWGELPPNEDIDTLTEPPQPPNGQGKNEDTKEPNDPPPPPSPSIRSAAARLWDALRPPSAHPGAVSLVPPEKSPSVLRPPSVPLCASLVSFVVNLFPADMIYCAWQAMSWGGRRIAMKPVTKLTLCSIVAAAALYAAETQAKKFTPTQLRWWAFQPVAKPAVPAIRNTAWAKTSIDAFVAAKLEEKELTPNPSADKGTLLRRAYLDLIGIPPSPEETQAFIGDNSPKAFENVIDTLLASPRYGERWARHWLDLARYADSEGFKSDETRPNVWRYRDYVIKSFNADKPYDRFVREQIAGDELYPENPEAKIAVAFNRHFPDESNARNLMQRRQEFLNDITDTVASTFLGLTYGCARCHDHKFDPILHKDYYRLQAFFANTRIEDRAVLLDKSSEADWKTRNANWEAQTKAVRDEMHALAGPLAEKLNKDDYDKFPEEIQDAINCAPEKRTPIQWHMYYKAKPYMSHSEEAAAKTLRGAQATRYKELKTALAKFDSIKPPELPVAQTMIDLDGGASPKTHVLAVGVYDAYREEVQPGFLSILDASDAKITPSSGIQSSGRRSALANWLADPKNPLSTRVIVNRVWHYHFGKGISGTPSDFGVMGERPANKDLLDYLTADFIGNGWSIKKLHKTIMMSATWQQSSAYNEASAKIDPDNKYMWRFSRRRLEGETIRDSMLAVSGRLNTKMFGPGIYPPMPAGVETRGGWKKDESQEESDRRSVYVFVRRNTRYPMFEAFDMPDTHESCSRRNNTVTPSQSLELLNNNLVIDWAKSLADRVTNDTGLTKETQVDRAYRMAYSRTPSADERRLAVQFLNRQSAVAGGEKAAFVDFCHMLLNSNEFVYLN